MMSGLFITNHRPEVLVRPNIGEDCSVLDFREYACVLSTDPITGTTKDIGSLAVHISCTSDCELCFFIVHPPKFSIAIS